MCRVQGSGFRGVQGSGFRVQGLMLSVGSDDGGWLGGGGLCGALIPFTLNSKS